MAKFNKKEGVIILVGLENDPRIPITEVMKAGYIIEDDQLHPWMNEWKVIIRRSSDNSIVTEEEVFDALAPKPVAVTSTSAATNGDKADPFGEQMPTVGITVLGSTKAPNKAADKTAAVQATNSNGTKIGVLPASSSSVPATAQPAQQTPPPPQREQKVVEVDYARIDSNIKAQIKPLITALENTATEADLKSAVEEMRNIRDEMANMLSTQFRLGNGDDPGGYMTVLARDVSFLLKRVKAAEEAAYQDGYQQGAKDAETNKFWVALYSVLGVTTVILLAGFWILSII